MASFAERLGFRFEAHEIGDANRSARVERPFHFIAYTVGTAPRSLAVMDYNGDGKLDVAVTAYGASFINVLLGNGDGTFQNGPTFKSGQQPTSVRSADFNGDKRPDLVVTNGGFPLNPPTLQTFVTILLNTPLSFSTTFLTFSTRKVGTTSASMPVTLTNVGAMPVSLMGVTITGPDLADFASFPARYCFRLGLPTPRANSTKFYPRIPL